MKSGHFKFLHALTLCCLLFSVSCVVGGIKAKEGAWPWAAALALRSPQGEIVNWYCGGSLIQGQWILTAAHCLFLNKKMNDWIKKDNLEKVVILGRIDMRTKKGNEHQIDSCIPAPSYEPEKVTASGLIVPGSWDVGLIKIKPAASATSTEPKTISLVSPAEEGKINEGTVIGWGKLVYSQWVLTPELWQVEIPIVTNAKCNSGYNKAGAFIPNPVNELMFCAGIERKDSCVGDSGGPFMVEDSNGNWDQAGVVSWGYLCAHPDYYGVYVNTSRPEIYNWIDQTMRNPSLTMNSSFDQSKCLPTSP